MNGTSLAGSQGVQGKPELPLCACGCGRRLPSLSYRGQPRRFFSPGCRGKAWRARTGYRAAAGDTWARAAQLGKVLTPEQAMTIDKATRAHRDHLLTLY